MSANHILRNLHSLIRNSTLKYMNEFVWQDIELTEEFKNDFTEYLRKSHYDIEFFTSTAVITSSSTKYIYVPNQWFVIASYVVDVYEELQLYKSYFKKVSEKLGNRLDEYAKTLRDNASTQDKIVFIECAQSIFKSFCSDSAIVEEAASRLWRFVNDYSWWSGQKTIDRGDFFVSVILNMLNLVNVSQGYVADIASAYANDFKLRKLIRSTDGFTVNMYNETETEKEKYLLPDEEIRNSDSIRKVDNCEETIPKPEKVKIKINGENTFREIRFKG